MPDNGIKMHQWAQDLWPICRSLTGEGVRQTLKYIQNLLPELSIHEIPTGTKVFDWDVPPEWNIKDAYIADKSGKRIIDFRKNNLHVVGYSIPVDQRMTLQELDQHLYSLPNQVDAIPYVTSYYEPRWGFCLTHQQRQQLEEQEYHVVIDSSLKSGVLNYAELIIPGKSKEEVLLSTYICHPSMANNELSGPVVTIALARWLNSLKQHQYTYRIIFIPETIGSIVYLSLHAEVMKEHCIAGFVITCIGDERTYSYMPSRHGNTLADRAAKHILKHHACEYKAYTFLERGSDERQYCSPGIDLPVCSIMRSKYGEYPEYHTSLDNLNFVTPTGLQGGFEALQKTLTLIENNAYYRAIYPCEPQLGKRGLYPTISKKNSGNEVRNIMNLLAYADGTKDLIEIADITQQDALNCLKTIEKLMTAGLIKKTL